MELFSKGNAVKLLSHHNMFLLADEDQKTIRQSRQRCTRLAIWTVETVIGKPKLIRLRSCHGTYLTASSKPFLLGTTGERVTQTQSFNNPMDCQTHWEPGGYGASVKLKSWCGKWMRANGGAPPWRKSVTHDEPPMSKTKNWLLWYVITVDGFDLENVSDGFKSSLSSPLSPHLPGLGFWSAPGSPVCGRPKKSLGRFASLGLRSTSPRWSPKLNMKQKAKTCSFDETETVSAVEFFRKAKAVRICSSHNKYLTADENEETVSQGKNGSTENAQWTVELVSHSYHVIRLKSCYGKYLTASNERFLLGVTGKKVMQLKPSRLDSSVEWEPVREGSKILLKSTYGNYLRANDGPPPRRKSVTHDNPRSATLESISWEVDVVEILINPQLREEMEFTPSPRKSVTPAPHRKPSNFRLSVSHSMTPSSFSYISNSESDESPSKVDGRVIDYHINPSSKAEIKYTPSSKKTLPSPPHRKPSWNPFSLSDKSDSDCDESPSKSDGRAINYHINPPFKSTLSSKKTLYQPPNRKLSNSSHSKTPSSLSDISDSNFDESSSKPNEQTIDYHINKPSKAEMKSTSSSQKMSPHRRPSNFSHSKTPSFIFDRSESDSDESPSKWDEQTSVYHINPSFKTENKSTPSSKKMLHSPSHSKPSNSLHSKTPSSPSDISDSTSDESPSQSDEKGYHINHSFKFEMIKSTSSSKKPSNSHHSKTSSFFDRSDSDYDESPSNSTLPWKKTLHPPPHKKPSNSPHSKTPSSLSDKSDSESDESPSKLDVQTVDYHINPPFKVAMKSSMSSKKILHGNSVESPPLKPNGRTIYYSIADERHMENKSTAGYFFTFRGNSVAELTQTLREETCLEDVVVCTRNPLSGKLSPLRLQLPPNNGILHLVLLPSSGSLYERRENRF
ncbi:uncharacterized protein LOC103829222 isoform X5 [Brassica rapa]|uniref:uncharacterized protein LOC103829222 isoform X5 n=1 Tax=Brassica campestris TaxID=3711 RepID=UPI00142DC37E|nr:uncharacterized protein LOC103829222 isoform X5 [Brassica rapa]